MADSSSTVCAICFETFRDPRFLNCLHSFCTGCLDDLDVRSGHAHKITCPISRSTCRLPEKGAASLAKDITVKAEGMSRVCHLCSSDDEQNKPEVMCTTCDLSFCKQHAFDNVKSTGGHILVGFTRDAPSSPRPTTSSAQPCDDYGLPVMCFCHK